MIEYEYVKTKRANMRPINDGQVPWVRFVMRWATRLNVAVFRASKGRLMNKFIGGYPDFDEYQARTDRNIPVFSCQPTLN